MPLKNSQLIECLIELINQEDPEEVQQDLPKLIVDLNDEQLIQLQNYALEYFYGDGG